MAIQIELADQQRRLAVDPRLIHQAVQLILHDHGPTHAQVSVAIVDDATIHQLNRRFLQHDYPTDVLSFVLDQDDDHLDGEVIVSSETACSQAGQYGLRPEDELLLYVIHGTLHLVGFDDQTAPLRQEMRCAEQAYLEQLGVNDPKSLGRDA